MVDASMLQGYLMKEKSKMSLLHGLTGDINKRYFRVRTIEGGDELALCYYKNTADPVVRGWIYLKDMTEIAEIQDTMILTSVARTLYLYAQTRAEHNVWVTGLAKLCPGAFVKLGRNAPAQKEMGDSQSTISSRTSPPKPEARESPSARDDDHDRLPDEDEESNGRIEPQATPSLDDDESNPSSDEERSRLPTKPNNSHERSKPVVRDNGSSKAGTGSSRESGRRNASWRTPRGDPRRAFGRKAHHGDGDDGSAARAVNKCRQNGRRQGLRSSEDGDTCSQDSSNDGVKGADGNKMVRARDKKSSQHGRHGGADNWIAKKDGGTGEQRNDTEIEASRKAVSKGKGGTDFERNECSTGKQSIRLSIERNHKDISDGDLDSDGGDRERRKTSTSRDVERVESRDIRPTISGGADTAGATEKRCDKADDNKLFRADHGFEKSASLRAGSSGNENVKPIELNASVGRDCTAGYLQECNGGTVAQAHQGTDGLALENELKGSNQDEEGEFDEEAENVALVPQLEILDWEGPRQGQSATSRLHRHISGKNDPEDLGSVNFTLPPPKEFLASRPLQSPARVQGEIERKHTPPGQGLESERVNLENGLENGLKPTRKGRRTSAADVEWSDGAEAQAQPRRFDGKISPSTDYGPINLGDSDDDGDEEDDFDIEIEKQRRRANAAVLALEIAAKEADEGAQADIRKGSDCKRPCENVRKKLAKVHRERCVPSPAGPPPAGVPRNGRRGQGVPPPRIAPPKLASDTPAKQASHRIDSDTSDNSNWDDELKTPYHGSPTGGSGGLPAAVGASEVATASTVYRGQANDWEHFDD